MLIFLVLPKSSGVWAKMLFYSSRIVHTAVTSTRSWVCLPSFQPSSTKCCGDWLRHPTFSFPVSCQLVSLEMSNFSTLCPSPPQFHRSGLPPILLLLLSLLLGCLGGYGRRMVQLPGSPCDPSLPEDQPSTGRSETDGGGHHCWVLTGADWRWGPRRSIGWLQYLQCEPYSILIIHCLRLPLLYSECNPWTVQPRQILIKAQLPLAVHWQLGVCLVCGFQIRSPQRQPIFISLLWPCLQLCDVELLPALGSNRLRWALTALVLKSVCFFGQPSSPSYLSCAA